MTNMKKCPMCAEEIPLTAETCEYCGVHFEVTGTGYCQNCHQVRDVDVNGQCKICGNTVVDLRVESRFTEEPKQEPLRASQRIALTEITKAGKSRLPMGILAGILIFAVIGASLWFERNLPAHPNQLAINTSTIPSTFTSSPTITPQPSATATPLPDWAKEFWQPNIHLITGRSPDFQDDFSQSSTAWQFHTNHDRNKGEAETGEGVLAMQVEPGEVGFSTNSRMRFNDFILQVNSNLQQLGDVDAAAEIEWRGSGDTGEVFSIWGNGKWQIAFCGGGDCDLLASGMLSLLPSKLVTITIMSRGTEIAVFLDSTPLCHINDKGRRPGKDIKLGLWVNENSQTAVAAEYYNLKVWNLSGVKIPTPVPTASPVSPSTTQAANTPVSGTGIVTGRILWNDRAMSGVTVTLCKSTTLSRPGWSLSSKACIPTENNRAITGKDGHFTIILVHPGLYYFITRLPDQENETVWFDTYASVRAGQIVTVDDISVIKYDIKLSAPGDNTTVTTTTPTLDWELYPEAAYYKVYILNHQMDEPLAGIKIEKVSVSQYIFKNPLAPGKYSWSIQAYNAAGKQISGRGLKLIGSSNYDGTGWSGEGWWNSFVVAP